MAQPPSFPFYPADWIAGTARMSLAEKGAYIDALAHQWHADEGLPTNPVEVARIIRATPAEARKAWPAVAKKFTETADGLRNDRLEKVRAEKRAYSASQANNGRRSAAAKAQRTVNDGSTIVEPTPVQPSINSSLSSSSSSSSSPVGVQNTPTDDRRVRVGASSPFLRSTDYERLRRTHAYVGARLRVPNVLHDEFVAKLGGEDPHSALLAWYAGLDEALELSREPIPDVFVFLRPKFTAWAQSRHTDDALAKWVAEG